MSSLLQLPNHLNINSIKNLIFDLGNVLVKINQNGSAVEFKKLGAANFAALPGDVITAFQTGKINSQQFRAAVRASIGLPSHVTDMEFDQAWSAPLLKFASGRLELIQQLRTDSGYNKVYVLSNSDPILTECMNNICLRDYHEHSLDPFFDKVFYSHEIGWMKPYEPVFKFVINDQHLVPGETLFMDDSADNIRAARSCGLQAVEVDINTDLSPLRKADSILDIENFVACDPKWQMHLDLVFQQKRQCQLKMQQDAEILKALADLPTVKVLSLKKLDLFGR
ncbi:hypothetical protein BGZ81_000711 [Podila clonocystis]|nr:hypothetical protein BGZ81_000711 [Podila clonocystis]